MDRFDYVGELSREQEEALTYFRKAFAKLETNLDIACSEPTREKSLAVTKLEEAAMWISKAICRKGN